MRLANLATKSGVSYTYGNPNHEHAVTRLSNGNTYAYDQNGNMTYRKVGNKIYNLTYDVENHLTGVSGAATANFVYNGDGQRVKATEGVTTTFVGNYFEWTGSTSSMVRYYYAGAVRVAKRSGSSTLLWLLGDHLGSASVAVNADGTLYGTQGYKAFGEVRFGDGSLPTDYQYTGQFRQKLQGKRTIGLYYYGARWYDPALGRFIQPDTIIPSPGNSADFDRYAYVRNNPLRFSDPSGHKPCEGKGENDCEVVGHGGVNDRVGPPRGYGDPYKYCIWVDGICTRQEISEDVLEAIALVTFAETGNGVYPDWAQELIIWALLNREPDPNTKPYTKVIGILKKSLKDQDLFHSTADHNQPAIAEDLVENFYKTDLAGPTYMIILAKVKGIYEDKWLAGKPDPTNGATFFSVANDLERDAGYGKTIKFANYTEVMEWITSNYAWWSHQDPNFGYYVTTPFITAISDTGEVALGVLSLGTQGCVEDSSCGAYR